MRRVISIFGVTLLLTMLLTGTVATGAMLLTDSGGNLIGATHVDVVGSFYDVSFVDGACSVLFSGCDEASDFTFTTLEAAFGASEALLDQVFVDGGAGSFDTDPELTNGCSSTAQCFAITPYAPLVSGYLGIVAASNLSGQGSDSVFDSFIGDGDVSSTSDVVYAVWTPVPEPDTGVLVGVGLALLWVQGRKIARLR